MPCTSIPSKAFDNCAPLAAYNNNNSDSSQANKCCCLPSSLSWLEDFSRVSGGHRDNGRAAGEDGMCTYRVILFDFPVCRWNPVMEFPPYRLYNIHSGGYIRLYLVYRCIHVPPSVCLEGESLMMRRRPHTRAANQKNQTEN